VTEGDCAEKLLQLSNTTVEEYFVAPPGTEIKTHPIHIYSSEREKWNSQFSVHGNQCGSHIGVIHLKVICCCCGSRSSFSSKLFAVVFVHRKHSTSKAGGESFHVETL